MWLQKIAFRFSVAQTFKSRSKLTDFYKVIHPDMLNNAPDKVKEENARSLKILNSYFDSVVQNQKTNSEQIIFYIPDKSNEKARKFHPIEVVLEPFRGDQDQNIKDIIDQTISQLMGKLSKKQDEINTSYISKKKYNQNYVSTDEKEKFQTDFLSTTNFIKKHKKVILCHKYFDKNVDQINENALNLQAYQISTEEKFKDLQQLMAKEMYQANIPVSKPKLWASIMLKENNPYTDLYEVFNNFIDPRMIYIDPKLTNEQVDQFKQRLVLDQKKKEEIFELQKIFKQMETSNPQIFLYVTTKYGSKDLPGYFSVPYNFRTFELIENFLVEKSNIFKERKQFEKELKDYESIFNKLITDFRFENFINRIVSPITNFEIARKTKIALLQLHRIFATMENGKMIRKLNNLREMQMILSEDTKDVYQNGTELYINPSFEKENFLKIIEQL